MLCDSNYVTFCKRQNNGDSKKSVVAKGWLGRQMNKQKAEDFQGNENTLCDTINGVHPSLHIFSNPQNAQYLE